MGRVRSALLLACALTLGFGPSAAEAAVTAPPAGTPAGASKGTPKGGKATPPKKTPPKAGAPKPGGGKARQGKAPPRQGPGRPAKTGKPRRPPKKPAVVFDQAWAETPSARYGALDREACLTELRKRGIEFTVVERAAGVLAPVRLPKDLAGVVWRTEVPEKQRATSPWDVFDCRVVLSLHDWSPRLRGRGIEEVLLFSAWRPPSPKFPEGELSTRHPGALAVDVKRFVRTPDPATGAARSDLDVDRDWDPKIGAPICGDLAPPPSPSTEAAKELRDIACEADLAKIFTVMLTPHYDHAHRNHLHLEVTPEVSWRLTK